ncbi:crossover junction endodeoxyribonuclease RuvC [Patescibacteria group bacterium]|nr:crossover junction endodeoxyribonuclease RuvC [Patescibacteria group bacterium]
METTVLGIDPGLAIVGFGIVKINGNKVSFINCGQIKTHKSELHTQRLAVIVKSIKELVEEYQPTVVGIESLFFARNTSTAMKVAEARGAILSVLASYPLSIVEHTPLQVKQSLTGYGSADKQQVLKMIKSILKLETLPGPDDISDALAIAVCTAFSHQTSNRMLK